MSNTPKKFQELTKEKLLDKMVRYLSVNDKILQEKVNQVMPNNNGIKLTNVADNDKLKILEINCEDFVLAFEIRITPSSHGCGYIVKDIKGIEV